MKRLLFILFCLGYLLSAVQAQDIIMQTNGKDIRVKVTEINSNEIKYKIFDNLSGPDFGLLYSDIFMIKYENGDKDMFEKNPATGKIQIRHIVNPNPKQSPATNTIPEQKQSPVQPPISNPLDVEKESGTRNAAEQEIKSMNNGTFEMISADAENVQFKAGKTTSLYRVAFVSEDNKIINAVNISNIKGDIHLGNGATASEGSFLMFTNKIELPENTVVKCGFKDLPSNFKPGRILFLTDEKAVAMYFDLTSGEWAKTYLAPPSPKTEPDFDARSGEYDIVELIEHRIVEAEINGRDITNVNVRVRKRVSYPVNVRIPVGSYFVSANPAAQNMVATGAKNMRLTGDGWQNISVPAACANRPKNIPDSNDKFTVIRSPNQAELVALMPVLNKAGADMETKQAAVWIVTDNANYSELGILVASPGNARAIGVNETARAMKICADAGIDITKKRIWNDKKIIVDKLPAGTLKSFFNE
jgi:hypothetical protein